MSLCTQIDMCRPGFFQPARGKQGHRGVEGLTLKAKGLGPSSQAL